jgi:tricorn protease
MLRFPRILGVSLVLCAAASPALAGISARMMRYPDVSQDRIVFVYAGDVWVAPKEGGAAQRLSSPEGEESFPRFSPDGSRIAFTGNYDGNADIYVIPTEGGIPSRLTHHPFTDRVVDWYPDGGSILYATMMTSGRARFDQFYKVSPEGGMPQKLPVPYGEFGSISEDGTKLAYTLRARDFRTWKRYRGGMNPDIWVFDLVEHTSQNITHDVSNDGQPMWHGNTIYFLSDRDRNMRANIWAYDGDTGEFRQVTHFDKLDVHFPSMGPDEIVFECGGRLYLMDLESEETREVAIEVTTDRSTLKPRNENVGHALASGAISPTGKRAVLEARGEIYTLPAEHGVVRHLTHSSGYAERHPVWSPDGKWVAYFSDASGEYELTLRAADGTGEERKLTSLGPGYRYRPFWSPDSEKIAFIDQTMTIRMVDVKSKKVTTIDQGLWMFHYGLTNFTVSWSPDSRWLAYSRGLDNRNRVIFLYDTESGDRHQVTTDFYNDSQPVFDPDGKYLYFLTNRTFEPSYSDIDNTWIYANTTNLAAVPLREDVESPLAPRNDEEEVAEEEEAEETEKADEEKKEEEETKEGENGEKEPVEIDLDGFEGRLVILPPEAGNYSELSAVSGKVIYHRRPRTGSGDEESPIVYYDLEEREEKTIMGDADGYDLSADGKKLLVVKNGTLAIIDVAPDQKMDKPLDVSGMETTVDPMAEWKQIFNDVWRFERDYFYDPDMHGVGWKKLRQRYEELLADAVTRWDVNYVIGELIAELNSSHTYRFGGDVERPESRDVGLLGAELSLENGAYRISKIYGGAPWDSEVRSPLDRSGVDVEVGDYLLAVNGVPLDTSKDPWAALQGLAGNTVAVTVSDDAEGMETREVLVEPLSAWEDMRLRNLTWINEKRMMVEEATDGRVGYVYVPNTSISGQNELVRQFAGQFQKEGLIIDERFNSGGQIPDRFVELLNRPLYNYWAVRDGRDWPWPPIAHNGPEVMLINGWSGSGGDAFPLYFRQAGRGPLIGTRTWGGLIGISGAPRLIDGGFVTAPTFGIYSTEGEWIVEGHGVDPDIEVVDDPALMMDGGDPQLERAIEEVRHMLEESPPVPPGKPDYPKKPGT